MPYNEAPPIIQNITAKRTRIIVLLMSAIAVLFVIFIAVAGFVLYNQNQTLEHIDDNTTFVNELAQQAVENAGAQKCRSRVVNQYLVSIGDLLEEDGVPLAEPNNQADAIREGQAFVFYREQSRQLSEAPAGEGPCDNVDEEGYPIAE